MDLSPLGTAIWDWVTSVIAPQLAKMTSWLDMLAFYFGTFLPSLPYAIFMVVVAGWLLAVVQAVIAAPLWAIMHMRPSQTFIGSDQQGYLLLLSLFARPALAILGLFAGLLIADPVVDYLAKGFFSMRTAIVTSQESLGWVVEFFTFVDWLTVFGLVLLPVTYMVFGLPQTLPDHVLKWIGAGISDLGETQATNHMRGGMERAALQGMGGGGGGMLQRRGGGSDGGPNFPSGGRSMPSGGSGARASSSSTSVVSANPQGVVPATPESPSTTLPTLRRTAAAARPISTGNGINVKSEGGST